MTHSSLRRRARPRVARRHARSLLRIRLRRHRRRKPGERQDHRRRRGLFAQAYFVYDAQNRARGPSRTCASAKAPIRRLPDQVRPPSWAVTRLDFLDRIDILAVCRIGCDVSFNTPHGPKDAWRRLPRRRAEQIIDQATALLRDRRVARCRANRDSAADEYGAASLFLCAFACCRGNGDRSHKAVDSSTLRSPRPEDPRRNFAAVDRALEELHEVAVPAHATSTIDLIARVPSTAPEFVRSRDGQDARRSRGRASG